MSLNALETNSRINLGLTSSYFAESSVRESVFAVPHPLTVIVGGGTGIAPAIANSVSEGHACVVFESESHLGGRLELVAPEKAIYRTGLQELLELTTHPNVLTYLDTPLELVDQDYHLSAAQLIRHLHPQRVVYSPGTLERVPQLESGERLSSFQNFLPSYTLAKVFNELVTGEGRPAELSIPLDQAGGEILIAGGGLVSLEDVPRILLTYQLDKILSLWGIDPRENSGFDYIDFSAKPIKKFADLYASDSDSGREIRKKLGDLDPTPSDLFTVLQTHGLLPVRVLYRKDKSQIIRPPDADKKDPRIPSQAVQVFQANNGFTLTDRREVGFATGLPGEYLGHVTLLEGHYNSQGTRTGYTPRELIRPALVIGAVGGTVPPIAINGHSLSQTTPSIRHKGTVHVLAGMARDGSGNRKKSQDATIASLDLIRTGSHLHDVPGSDVWTQRLLSLAEFNLVPANTVLASLSHLSPKMLKRWKWI